MVKIAYVVQWGAGPESGVFKKIVMQVKEWVRIGNEAKLFVLGRQYGSEWEKAVGRERVVHVRFKSAISGLLATTQLVREIAIWRPDVVYARAICWPAFMKMSKRFPLVLEINSDDLAESRLRCGMGVQYNLMTEYNLLTRRMWLQRAAGIVYVTSELPDRPAFEWLKTPKAVVRNGCDLGRIQTVEPNDIGRYGAFFLGSVRQEWQGVDEIVEYAAIRPEVDFYLVGPDSESLGTVPANVFLHGAMDAGAYRLIAAKCDIAFGPLALYRKGLSRATALKVPEYLAMGLPVVLGYTEEGSPETCDYMLRLPNEARALLAHDSRVVSFLCQWRARRVNRDDIMWCDISVTESKRIEFFESVIAGQRSKAG